MAKKKPDITLKAAVDGHLRFVASAYSRHTLKDYRQTHEKFMEFTGERLLRDVSSADVEDFMIHMKTTPIQPAGVTQETARPSQPRYRRPKTLANMHIALSALWTWAEKRGFVEEHVVQQVPRPKVNESPIIPLTTEEVVALIRACNESRPYRTNPLASNSRISAERDKAIVGVLVETAVRVSELVNLRYGDVSFHRTGGMLYIDLGKGNKSRQVPFSRRCANLLSDYLLTRPDIAADDWLFVNVGRNSGLPMTRGTVLQLINRLGDKIGVKVSPHRLRTTAACMLVTNGCTAWQLKEIMGHADISTTMRYVRAAQIDLEGAMQRASPLDNLRL